MAGRASTELDFDELMLQVACHILLECETVKHRAAPVVVCHERIVAYSWESAAAVDLVLGLAAVDQE